MEIVVLKSTRYPKMPDGRQNWWEEVMDHLKRRKTKCYCEPQEADVSIVLSGMFENPALVSGKKVLAFRPQEWVPSIPPPKGWMLYSGVLAKYYDDFIDLSGLTPRKSAKRIIEYIDEVKESRSQN